MRRTDIKTLPSLEVLRHLFAYNPETGVLIWRVRPNEHAKRIKMGMPVGTVGKKHGYLVVGIGRSYFLVHRIIWKLQTGADPEDQVDHRDTDRLNNRWENLRPTDNTKNIWNSRLRRDNTSGFKGVVYKPENRYRKWAAKIYVGGSGRSIHLGSFHTPEEASAAWKRAAIVHRDEFARVA
jgi:hypothetical protein